MAKVFKWLKKLGLILLLPVLLYIYFLKLVVSPAINAVHRVLEWQGVIKPPPAVMRTPEERFATLAANSYPFKPNYIDFNGVRVHYVDERPPKSTRTLLLLHGEPSWSFLYRHMIPFFVAAGYRVVAPDFIGFGRSDKYTSLDAYSHELHTATLIHLITRLDLQRVTMVMQDWGGLTGLSVTKEPAVSPRITSLVIMNTGLPGAVINGSASAVNRVQESLSILVTRPISIMAFLSWRTFVAIAGKHLPVAKLFRIACKGLPASAAQCYEAPFHSPHTKAGAAKWPLLVPIVPVMHVAKDMQRTADYLRTFQNPVKIIFSDRDPITRGLDKWFKRLIPGAGPYPIVIIERAGHFLQEDKGEEIARHILEFLVACDQRSVPAAAAGAEKKESEDERRREAKKGK